MAPDLSAERITEVLEQRGFSGIGRPLAVVAETGSTNEDARRAAAEGAAHGATIVADRQTRGRGRGERRWHSPAGDNIYTSSVLRLDLALEALAPLSLAAGVAVARCCDEVLGRATATVKWPNDVYLGDRKVAGILIETTSRSGQAPALVVGVGVNVRSRSFPDDFAARATSLLLAGGDEAACERNEVAGRLFHHLGEVCRAYADQGLPAVLAELRQRDFLTGRRLRVDGRSGVADGIDDRGRLRLRGDDGGVTPIVAGDVIWGEA